VEVRSSPKTEDADEAERTANGGEASAQASPPPEPQRAPPEETAGEAVGVRGGAGVAMKEKADASEGWARERFPYVSSDHQIRAWLLRFFFGD
jgi:hypothetical protein